MLEGTIISVALNGGRWNHFHFCSDFLGHVADIYIQSCKKEHMYLQNNTKLKVEDKERNGKRNNNYLIKYCISGRFYTMVSKDQYNPYIYTYTLTIKKLLFSSIDNFFSQD